MNQQINKVIGNSKNILVIIFAVTLFVSGILTWQNCVAWGEKVKETKEISKGKVSDWKTYRNKEFGFEVKYPQDSRTVEMVNGITDIDYVEDEHTKILIYTGNSEVDNTNLLNEKLIKINDVEFYSEEHGDNASGGVRSNVKTYKTMHNNMWYIIESIVYWREIYFIKGTTGATNEEPTKEEIEKQENWIETQEKINEQIILTFKFIK